nr:MAG TPA: hypothetical protein [Caudoviricetes sp.]
MQMPNKCFISNIFFACKVSYLINDSFQGGF